MNPLDRIKQLQAELARVTAERDEAEHKARELTAKNGAEYNRTVEAERKNAALRARVAELEAALREEKRIHPEDFQPCDTKNIHYYFEVD